MSEIIRILSALLALFMQLLGQLTIPVIRPTATPTSIPTSTPTVISRPSDTPTSLPTLTPVPTSTQVASSTPRPTSTPAPTATSTQGVTRDNDDPTGFLVAGEPPAQKLPSAVLIYPLVSSKTTEDTIVEMVNLSNSLVNVKCHYISTTNCRGIDFFVRLTAAQPIAWRLSTGRDGNNNRIAPPFNGEAEMKCFVQPNGTSLSAYNTIQGRGTVQDTNGQTIGYAAIGLRRLSPGSFSGQVRLDGQTYEQCPDRLHFQALTSQSGSDSELILAPCEEDLLRLRPANSAIQFAVINEFEQQFSGSIALTCFSRRRFSTISPLRRSATGTDTVHAIIRSIDVPVVGLVVDRFTVPGSGAPSTSANSPFLEGGRSSTITIPDDNF